MQLNSGLYGALLVLAEGHERDPNEHIFLMGEGGPIAGAPSFVNGSAAIARAFGWVGSRVQTGALGTYAWVLVVGVLAVLGAVTLR